MAARMYQWRISNPERRTILRRRDKIRRILRERGFLPPHGQKMSAEQQRIYDEIGNDNYQFWDSVKMKQRLHDGGTFTRNHEIKKTKEELLLDRVKQGSRERGLEFNLELEDIIIPTFCPLLGIRLTFEFTPETRDSYYSIDRIDSTKGYVKGNVQVMSLKANTMKNSATHEELITFAMNVLEQYHPKD